jgi:hypothetical protein
MGVRGADALPPEVTRLRRAPDCDPRDEPIELAGPWLGISGADGETEIDLVAPYDLEVSIEESSSQRYVGAHLSIRVPAVVGRPLSREDLCSSLWEGGTISLTVMCRDGGYTAQQADARPPA